MRHGAKVLELQLQHQSFQRIFGTVFLKDGLVGSPCSPRDTQESSPTPQFKSISCSALSFLYSPTLTFIHDHWKNHSFDYIDLCHDLFLLLVHGPGLSWLSFQGVRVFEFHSCSHCPSDFGVTLSAVSLEPEKIKSVTASTLPPSICHEVWDRLPQS